MQAISLVEKGWAGARQLSIQLARRGVRVRHLVKGALSREVLEVLTPHEGMTIHGVPRRAYRPVAWLALQRGRWRGDLALVLVDNERAFQWVSRVVPSLGGRLVLIQEADDGSPRIAQAGAAVDPALMALDRAPS
ncbi:MAG: hypothetical protein HY599_03190 [Candidatus Omnitrophica bacterium]|nr:hypothetical protein [Candidatus Omnitrophota bacterium]